ncbi:MAG TPA: DUF692 family protein [Thermoanaerobaculia bacterium]|nr:DUF692 family protein [Thermoanaerobaculia bacterium]
MTPPALGVGVTYFGGLDPVLERCAGKIDVVEVEPQTLWYLDADGTYRPDREALDHLAGHPATKLMHGIGFPVGGTRPPDPRQVPPLLDMARALRPPWMSEHLSFNRAAGTTGAGSEFNTGFLLPPRQNAAGVAAAAASIRAMADALPMPLAVETGVNYLAPRGDEMDDGAFVAAVVEAADCGILLDLHNLWANEKNGRQSVEAFLAQIPLDRVWEIHLAGGEEQDGFWLDSHSGPVPDPLDELAARVIPRLPNLGAILFEIFPAYLESGGLDMLERQIDDLHRLWDRRGRANRPAPRPAAAVEPVAEAATATPTPETTGPTPEEWENALGALVVGRPPADDLGRQLAADPGIGVIRKLLGEFRAGMAVRTLKLTCRLLLLDRGQEGVRDLLLSYWRQTPPHLFASAEADGFRRHLAALDLDVPYLAEVLAFESAANATLVDGAARTVAFPFDPLPVLRALGEGRLPDKDLVREGSYEVELTPDGVAATLHGAAPATAADPPPAARLTSPQLLHR